MVPMSEFNNIYIYIFINIYIYITAIVAHGSSEYLAYFATYIPPQPYLSIFKDYFFTYNTKNYNT